MIDHTVTFGRFLDEFRRDFGGWSENTWRGNSGMLKRLCQEFGEYRLIEIKPRQVDGYLNRRRREGLSEGTVNRYLCGLKTLFAVAKLWEYVKNSPVAEIRTLKEQGKIPEALTDDELRDFVDHCPPKLRTIVTIAADTGMRKSELQRLSWGDTLTLSGAFEGDVDVDLTVGAADPPAYSGTVTVGGIQYDVAALAEQAEEG